MPELQKPPIPSPPLNWKPLSQSGWLYPLLACFLLVLLFSAKRIGSYDLGTHLAGGRWILQHHSFPLKDTFTYTQNNQNYLDSHGLYQIALFLTQTIGGYSALTLLHLAVITLSFGILFWRLRLSRTPPGSACLLLLAAAILCERRFVVRPEVFSWFYISLTLLVLEFRTQNKNFLFLLPLLQFLWINTEGLFMLGWLAVAAHALSGRFHRKKWDPLLVRYGLLSLAADCLNPYFLKGAAFPLVLLTRFQSGNLFHQTISEFSAPWDYWRAQTPHHDSSIQILLFFALSVPGFFLLAGTLRRRKLHEFLIFLSFAWLGGTMVRNIPLFAFACLPILASAFGDTPFSRNWNWKGQKTFPAAAAILILGLCLRVMTNAYYVSDRRVDRFGLGLDPDRLPVAAAEFLESHHLEGRLLNNLDFGGWMDWKGSQPTFIDGRLEVMDQGFYGNYLQSFREPGLSRLLIQYQPQLILMEYNSAAPWVDQLRRLPNWRLIYLDECSSIYARGDYAMDLPALNYASLLTSRRIQTPSDGAALHDLEQFNPKTLSSWWGGFYLSQNYSMGLSSLGLFCLRAGEYETARDLFSECLRRSGGGYEEIYFNLGVSYLRLHQLSLGKKFLQASLEINPQNPATRQMLDQLQGF